MEMFSFIVKCPACNEPCTWSHNNGNYNNYNLEFFCKNNHKNIYTLSQFNEQKIPKINEHKIKYEAYCSDCEENMFNHDDINIKNIKKNSFLINVKY
jgi:hypothetical protein